ncbi:zinc finger CCHC domain-containing 24-like [Paramuricea clavata]|uniref:Zinc finger CCHC domain-containing 24-like n=1 Tax=Paramuricea clavata TaxID=317549 RepID=A0A6S7I5T5_PARCT|nr:zinc finger CCHC domain-containing 24-like [Paramuricea clavata]
MEAVTRWLCSFYADKVTVQHHSRTVTCGDEVLLCSIALTDPNSKFTDYHDKNKITVLYRHRNAEAVGGCEFRIEEVNSRQLNVFCYARRAGKARVKVDLGKWYQVECQDLVVDIVPSIPKYLQNVEVSCCEKPVDEQHRPERMGTLYYGYYGIESFLKFKVVDEFRNVIRPLGLYDVKIEYSYNNLEWEMRSGKICAIFLPKQIGEKQMVIRLKRLNSMNESTYTFQIPISIHHPPCSPSLTLNFLDDSREQRCTAGKEFTFKVKLYDVFGNPVLQDPKETCDMDVQVSSPKATMTKEQVNISKISKLEDISFAVTVGFKIAGFRKLRLIVNSGSESSFKYINVKVFPSTPDHFNDVRFTTHGAIDESFSADPTVVYRNQWSILEAEMVDRYNNVVRELSNDYNIGLQLFNDEGNVMEMEYQDVEFRNKMLRVQLKIIEAGKYNLAITLTNRNNHNQVVRLQEIQIQVNDAPLYLAGSKFLHPETCMAGEEIQLEIRPRDVFGFPLPADSTTDCNLTGDIGNLPFALNENKKTKNESNVVICVSIVLTKAGRRKVRIYDKDNKSKELSIQVNPDENYMHCHWEFAAPKTAYRRERLILTLRLFDRFNNEVRTDALENIPQLIKRDGPDGLRFPGESNNEVAIRCYFKRTGRYDLCLAERDGTCLESTFFSITVQDAPLDYHRSTIEWIPEYDEIPDQPVFPEDETFQCCLRLKDVLGYDYDTKIAKDCIKVRYGNTEVENIEVSSCPNDVGSYNIVVPLGNLVKDDRSPRFWCFVNGKKIENPLILPTFGGFEKHDDDRNCVVYRSHAFVSIVCCGVKRNDIIGSDYAHLNNIKRVCELDNDPKVDETYPVDATIRADLIRTVVEIPLHEIVNKIQKCRNILLHLIRATYYRKEAFKIDEAREDWKERASENYNKIEKGENIDKNVPHFCSQIKEKYARLMGTYHDAACDEFFEFFNAKRDQSEIDLHGLLVVDDKKLRDYERQLLRRSRDRMSLAQVQSKIEKERDHGNEAIRKLRKRLDKYDLEKAKEEGEPWLEIIVGSGHHSKVRQNSKVRQRIRPKVEEYLRERELEFYPVNKGALVVTFEEYAGSEPCFGEYYCNKCDKRWRNGRSWVGMWQACYDCYEKKRLLKRCYPLKQRSTRKQQRYTPNIVSRNQRRIPEHLEELCEKCIELGRPCPRA